MTWLASAADLVAAGQAFVIVTVVTVRGHAPRDAGAKMLVTPDDTHGSIGGGNLEQTAVLDARARLASGEDVPSLRVHTLTPHRGEHGVQCCGGEVSLLFETIRPVRPVVAIFGAGHVGQALCQVLALLPVDVRLIDSRIERLALTPAGPGVGGPRQIHAPVPEAAIADLPITAHAVVMTHDHAEDLAIIDTLLRRRASAPAGAAGYIGLIGSATKWARFRRELTSLGHDEAALALVTTPIGARTATRPTPDEQSQVLAPQEPLKLPAAIAVATAAELIEVLGLSEATL